MRPARSVTWPLWKSAAFIGLVVTPSGRVTVWQPVQSVAGVKLACPASARPNLAVSWQETHSAYEIGFAITIASRASLSWQVRQLFTLPGNPFEKGAVFPFCDHCHVYVWSGMFRELWTPWTMPMRP